MRDPLYAPLVIRQGRTNRIWFTGRIKQTGAVLDFEDAGYHVARLQVRDKHRTDGGTVLLDLTTDNGGIDLTQQADTEGAERSGYLYISAEAAATLIPFGEAVYDLYARHDNGEVDQVRYGPVVLLKDVSEL